MTNEFKRINQLAHKKGLYIKLKRSTKVGNGYILIDMYKSKILVSGNNMEIIKKTIEKFNR